MANFELSKKKAKKTVFVSGSTHPELAEATARSLGIDMGGVALQEFKNSELCARYTESVRGKHVIIMQTHAAAKGRSVNDSLQEQLLMADAAKRASAKSITAVSPMLAYSRQDRKSKGRETIAAAMVIQQLAMVGVSRIVSVDLHSAQMQAVFDGPFDHLTAEPIMKRALANKIGDKDKDGFMLVSPDAGRAKTTEHYSRELGIDWVTMPKTRDRTDSSIINRPLQVEEVDGKICFITDDMIDTAGTLVSAAETLERSGAKKVIALATHAVFSNPALTRLEASPISEIIVTDTMPTDEARAALGKRLRVLSIAPLIGQAISAIRNDESVSEIFDDYNYS